MLVAQECGRVLAGVPLLGHVPASYLLDRVGYSRIREVADGSLRAASCAARPPSDSVPWVPDGPGAEVLVVVGVENGEPVALAVEGPAVEDVTRYDRTRTLGHAT